MLKETIIKHFGRDWTRIPHFSRERIYMFRI